MSATQWRQAALAALWALVVATFTLAAYSLWRAGTIDAVSVLQALRSILAGLILVWWTQVFTRYTAEDTVPDTDGMLRALRMGLPWLTSLRLAMWLLLLLSLGSGMAQTASPVAVTALVTISGAFIFAKNAVFGTLAKWAVTPKEALGRVRLVQWLNVAAALSLALGVVNVVPIAGLPGSDTLDVPSMVIYGLHALLDTAAMLLALKAVPPPMAP
ncbi:hypothetical protein [Deinococcus sp.]|uniref:hypothetical protein n=1 Tax=Deinococcus sp. TaxID=47478 RepID=UPI002869D3B1|nr:hypothetical protein [Deinococcus sp.]